MIEERRVKRWFALGKGFGSKMAAARYCAKQALFDHVFGLKEEREEEVCPTYTYLRFSRVVPDDPAERLALWAKAFPLEECEGGGVVRQLYGSEGFDGKWRYETDYEDQDCSFACQALGYARCQSSKWMQSVAKDIMEGRKAYSYENGLHEVGP